MDFIMTDILSGELIPVLLGLSNEAEATAQRMYRKYGVVSHVFCDKMPFSKRFTLYMKFHAIRHTTDDRLMLQALYDFSGQLEHADVILYLIPCTENYASTVWNHRNTLERHFVIADKPEMQRVWFGESATTPTGGKT